MNAVGLSTDILYEASTGYFGNYELNCNFTINL